MGMCLNLYTKNRRVIQPNMKLEILKLIDLLLEIAAVFQIHRPQTYNPRITGHENLKHLTKEKHQYLKRLRFDV
jgi:hypothetical protein